MHMRIKQRINVKSLSPLWLSSARDSNGDDRLILT